MTTRTVFGTIRKLDGSLWPNAKVSFELHESGYELSSSYPRQKVTAITDSAGYFTVELWANQSALNRVRIAVSLPNEVRPFFIVVSPGPPVDLTVLRAAMEVEPGQTEYTALIGYLSSLLSGAGDALPAAEALPAYRAVALGTGLTLDLCDPSECRRLIGVVSTAVAQGSSVVPQRHGPITNPTWNWDLSKPVWVGAGGTLVQSETPSGFNRIVGYPATPTTLLIMIGEPYVAL